MSTNRRTGLTVLATGLLVSSIAGVAPTWAAPPSNDNRADAIQLQVPADLTGTLVDATVEPTNDSGNCGAGTDGSVWYRFTAPKRGAIIIRLGAAGEMDATVDLFKQVRSKLEYADCALTDKNGVATIDTDGLEIGAEYAIRVGRQTGSASAGFSMQVLVPGAPPEPPGKLLPAKGVRNEVDRLGNPGDAYNMTMYAGRTMRLSLRVQQCTSLSVYGPGTRNFSGGAEKTLSCGGYGLFTPTDSGPHFLVVEAVKGRGEQTYRLKVAPAGKDDISPGIFIGNNAKARGKVNGGIDSRDLYRFDVTRRSTLTLTVSGGPTLRLVRDDGGLMGRGAYIESNVAAGRYYVAVQGEGRYTLQRVSRTITTSSVLFNGRRKATVSPDATARIALRVRPAVDGPGLLTLERFDPIAGWQFSQRFRVNVTAGSTTVAFSPPSVGRYRVYGEYKGSKVAASSDAGVARLKVQGPLVD